MSYLCRNKQSDTTLFITQLCIVYTFTLFCRFEQKVRIAQWSTYRIFQSFLALQAWVQYSSVPLFFYSFFNYFQTFCQFAYDSNCILLQVQVSVSRRKRFFVIIICCICIFYICSIHLLVIARVCFHSLAEGIGLCSFCFCYSSAMFDIFLSTPITE